MLKVEHGGKARHPQKKKGNKRKTRLQDLDMSKTLDRPLYDERLAKLQLRLRKIQQAYLATGDSAVIVFEGWDAAGKGGTIRRMSAVLDPRGFKVWPIGAPSQRDKHRHYLTRFWEKLPSEGAISVFDRSWYGRVLVERIEGFASEDEWRRAYNEINAFEKLIADSGTRIVKIFLHITPDVQLKRFEERLRNPMKRWKLSYEDFRNRDKWERYEDALEEMFARTSTRTAPWTIVPANNKRYARTAAMDTIVKRLARGVDLAPRPLNGDVAAAAQSVLNISHPAIAKMVGRTE